MNKQDTNINEIVKILKSTMGDLQERRKNIMGRRSEFALTLTNGYPPENKKIPIVELYGTEIKYIKSRKPTIYEGLSEIIIKMAKKNHRSVDLSTIPLDAFNKLMKKAVKIGAVMDKDGKKALFGRLKGPTVDMTINTIGYGYPLTELCFNNIKEQFAEAGHHASVRFECDQGPIPQALKDVVRQAKEHVDKYS